MVENFKQALKEVFLPNKEENEEKQKDTVEEKVKVKAAEEKQEAAAVKKESKEPKESTPKTAAPQTAAPQEAGKKRQESKESKETINTIAKNTAKLEQTTNIITKDTKIVETITTDSKLIIEGEIEGGIDSKNIAIVSGNVRVDISCESAEIDSAQIEGNINVSDKLQI